MTPDEHWDTMIRGLRANDSAIVNEFVRRHGREIEHVADRRLARGLRRRVEPEDVAQSVCRTFLRRVQGGEFQLPDAESLWRLLCAITLTKTRELARFHLRQKRAISHEQPLATDADASREASIPVSRDPEPYVLVGFAEEFEQFIRSLEPEEQQVIDGRLQQCDTAEIAANMHCSERTVRRILNQLETRLKHALDVE